MSKQNEDALRSGEVEVTPRNRAALPRPPLLWLLIPIGLLALLAFLSRA
jgi:hypothetical protein